MRRRKSLQEELDELFADLWQVSRFAGLRRGFRPQVDSFTTEDPPSFTVTVEIAGIDPERVSVTAADRTLVISGERKRLPSEGRVYQQIEIEYGPFERVVQLPEDADVAHAEAQYERGLLTITMPIARRTAPAQSVPIEVRRQQ